MHNRANPSLFEILELDDTLPVDPTVAKYWVLNLQHPLRRTTLLVLRMGTSLTLFVTYFIKRLLPFQFSVHTLLQWLICWFMKWFVTPEANFLILRHFWTESNLINFVIANSKNRDIEPVLLYPSRIRDLMTHSFIKHDVALFNALHDLGPTKDEAWPVPCEKLDFSLMREINLEYDISRRKFTEFLDFETAHELFKALFCLLVTAPEYERSINSFQFDQTLALRIARIVDDLEVGYLAHNSFPMSLVGPQSLTYRFVLHGLFTEHLHAYLERLKSQSV